MVNPTGNPMQLVPQTWYMWQCARVCTQTAGGGGALTTRIQLPAGVCGKLVTMMAIGSASAGSTLASFIYDEDLTYTPRLAGIAAGAARSFALPSVGTAATANDNTMNTVGYMLCPGQFIVTTASVCLNTETLSIYIALLLNKKVDPVWDTTGSAGTPVLAANTISDANTWQEVQFPW